MRCPKCGYISFDLQSSCDKCRNNLSAEVEKLKGTTSKIAAPFFLGPALAAEEQQPVAAAAFEETAPVMATNEMDELEAEPLPVLETEVDIDFGEARPDEDEEIPPIPGLAGLDVSDLVPPVLTEDEPELPRGELNIEEPVSGEEEVMGEIEFVGLEPEAEAEALNLEGEVQMDFSGDLGEELPGGSADLPAGDESEEIIDLAALMDTEEPEEASGAKEAETDDDIVLTLDKDE